MTDQRLHRVRVFVQYGEGEHGAHAMGRVGNRDLGSAHAVKTLGFPLEGLSGPAVFRYFRSLRPWAFLNDEASLLSMLP